MGHSLLEQLLLKKVEVAEGVVFELMTVDPAELVRRLEIGNPIMQALQEAMQKIAEAYQPDENGRASFQITGLLADLAPLASQALSDTDTFDKLIERLNEVLVDAIQSPKLTEHDPNERVSIKNIPIGWKVRMLEEMYGGRKLISGLQFFRNGSRPGVVTRPAQ